MSESPKNKTRQYENSTLPSASDTVKTGGEQEWTLQLVYSLNASLDAKEIMQQYFNGIKKIIEVDTLHYVHPEYGVVVNLGDKQKHQFNYTLAIKDFYLGEISFSRHNAFSDVEVLKIEDLLIFLINPLSNALKHLDAIRSAMRDPLTGVGNRVAMENALHRDIELAKRYESPFSVLSLDIDHFKMVNDTYGHLAGDAYLKLFTRTVADTIRDSDAVFRNGGEEFLVILSETNSEGAVQLGQRLCEILENMHCDFEGKTIQTTTSIGVSTFKSGDNELSLLDRVDKALYHSKHNGRNQVSYFK